MTAATLERRRTTTVRAGIHHPDYRVIPDSWTRGFRGVCRRCPQGVGQYRTTTNMIPEVCERDLIAHLDREHGHEDHKEST